MLEATYGEAAIQKVVQRQLTKAGNKLLTDTIKTELIRRVMSKSEQGVIYAQEMDILNQAVFGTTAKQFKLSKPEIIIGNLRDNASVEELIVLAMLIPKMEEWIKMAYDKETRLNAAITVAADLFIRVRQMDIKRIQALAQSL